MGRRVERERGERQRGGILIFLHLCCQRDDLLELVHFLLFLLNLFSLSPTPHSLSLPPLSLLLRRSSHGESRCVPVKDLLVSSQSASGGSHEYHVMVT